MQIKETLKEGLKRAVLISVPSSELEGLINAKTEAARKDFNIQKMFGQSVREEVVQELIGNAMRGHFEGGEERPVSRPEITMLKDGQAGQDLEVSMSYEVLPEIPEADFGSLRLERLVSALEDESVEMALATLARSAQRFEAQTQGLPSEEGDEVVIDFKGAVDGVAFEGGSAEDFPLVLGSGSFIPGFEDQLVAKQAGDEVEVMVAFPPNYGAAHLAGKDAVFTCLIKEVRKPVPVALDDEMARGFGAASLDELREDVRARLEVELESTSQAVLRMSLLDALDELVTFDVPASLVETEAHRIAHQRWHAERPDHHGHDHPELVPEEEDMLLAERMVRLGLLLADVGDRNSIRLSEEEVQQAVMKEAQQYPGQEKEFLDFLQKNPQALHQITGPHFEAKVMEHIFGLAEITETVVSLEELRAAFVD